MLAAQTVFHGSLCDYRLIGAAGFNVTYGAFSHTSTFEPVDDNIEIVILGCDGTTAGALPSPVFEDENPGFVYTGQFNVRNGGDPSSCPAGEVGVVLTGTMDRFSGEENSMIFLNRNDASDSSKWIWNFFSFENNEDVEVGACLDPNECYWFFFYDTFDDGLLSVDSDGLALRVYSVDGLGDIVWEMPPESTSNNVDPVAWFAWAGGCEF